MRHSVAKWMYEMGGELCIFSHKQKNACLAKKDVFSQLTVNT